MLKAEQGGRTTKAFATTDGGEPARLRLARAGLWLIAAVLAVRQVAAVLSGPDGERLADLRTWVGPGGVLGVEGSLYDGADGADGAGSTGAGGTGAFTGTPFAGLVLRPLTRAAEHALGWGWTFGTLLLVVAVGLIAARHLPPPVGRRTALLAAPVAVSLLVLTLPVRSALWLGQTSVLPVLLVLLGCFVVRERRAAGLLVGVAAAFQPTLLLFAALLWLTGRRAVAVAAAAAFAGCTALTWAVMPEDATTYWIDRAAGTGLGGPSDALSNQSLHGALLRAGLSGPWEIALFLLLGAAVAVLALRRAVRYARDGQLLLAVGVTGCAAILVAPTVWEHQLLWVLFTAVGRVGRRASDRWVWPVAVAVIMTLPARMLLPHMEPLYPLRDNAVLLAALAAATCVPFLTRSSPYFAAPLPRAYADPVPARWRHVPLLRLPGRVLSRPNLLLELLLIRVTYAAYQHVRLAATGGTISGGRARAEEHGQQILDIERFLRLDIEYTVNHAVAGVDWLRESLDFYYTSFHFAVPLLVLGVLYWRRPVDYRWARTSLGFTTVLALVGFWLYPLAPPRLMPGLGIIDTVHGVQDFSKPNYGTLTHLTNQYAAMPSLHFGWSLWCGVVIVLVAPRVWTKALGLVHPLCTLVAIVGTGNHWILDAVGGAVVVAAGFGLAYLLQGPRARTATPGKPRRTGASGTPGASKDTETQGAPDAADALEGPDAAGAPEARETSRGRGAPRDRGDSAGGSEERAARGSGPVAQPGPGDRAGSAGSRHAEAGSGGGGAGGRGAGGRGTTGHRAG